MRNIDRKVWILQGYYQVAKLLEELSYSTVYLAQDVERGVEEYAIKEIELNFATKDSQKKAQKYFEKIAINYMNIYHPYLANVKDFFSQENCQYIVMKYVPGRRLQEILEVKDQPFSEIDIVDIGIMIASALEYLHKRDNPIFFADLFPSNIIITPTGSLELTDYGLGKILACRPAEAPFRGTEGYAPPEQYGPSPVIDAQTDLYALGAVLHQLSTARVPSSFSGRLPAVRELNDAISKGLEETIYRATEYDRKSRFRTAGQFLNALTGSKEEKPGKLNVKLWLNRILNRRKFEI